MEPVGGAAQTELEQKRQNVLKLIKSLLNSAQGDLTIEELERDYFQMVNEVIPYRQLHHATLASLLQSAPETVQLINKSGKLFVKASPGAKDHIAALVAGQRPSSKKKRDSGLMMRRPVPRMMPRPALLPHPNMAPHPLPLMNMRPTLRSPTPRWPQPSASAPQATRGKKPKHRGKAPGPTRPPPAYSNIRPGPGNSSFRYGAPVHSFRPVVPASNSMRPTFSKEREATVKELKQRLEKLVKELGYKSAVFRSVPLQNRWLATLEVNEKRYSSFPDERPTIEEAEAIVARKALDDLQHLSAAPACPQTSSLDLCISRVAELVRGEQHGLWFSHLCEQYTNKFGETLPSNFCERACARETQSGDTAITFSKHQNLWILYEKKEPMGTSGQKTSNVGSFSHQPSSLPHMAEQEQQQMSMTQQPSSLPNMSLSHSPARRTNSSSRPQQHPQAPPTKPRNQKSNRERPSLLRAVTMPVRSDSSGPSRANPAHQSQQAKPPHSGLVRHKSGDLSSAVSKANSSSTRNLELNTIVKKMSSLSQISNAVLQDTANSTQGARNESYAPHNGNPDTNEMFKSPDTSSYSHTSLSSAGSVPNSGSISSSSTALLNGAKEDSASDSSSADAAFPPPPQLPALQLPEEDTWQVYVTHILDDSRICFRLLGDSYNSAYEELVTRMELHYFDKENCAAPPSVRLGHHYALCHHETWARVLVVGLTESCVSALFVDHGETEEVAREDIFELAEQFMDLPGQCVTASLNELEGIRCPPLTSALHTKVLGQTFSASVVSRTPGVKVELYDTSASHKVNINDQLLRVVPESFTKPQLPQVGGIAEVFVTAVHDDGRVFVTIESETYTLLERMLAMAKVRAEELSGEAEVDLTKLYLARFSSDQDWHRVRAHAASSKRHKGSVVCECVDWGVREALPPHRLIDLTSLSPTLCLLPHQAMECRLATLPPLGRRWTRRASDRLQQLQPHTGPVLLKTVKVDPVTGVPEVLLFKRLLPQNELISINETLAIDLKLFSNSEENNNNESLSSDGERSVNSPPPQGASSSPPSSSSTALPSAAEGGPRKPSVTTPQVSPPCLPSVGDELDVYVTYAANPLNFAVQSVKEYSQLEKLRREMQEHYSSSSSAQTDAVTADDLVVGGYYAALHTDSYWYRVQLNQVTSPAEMVCGLFIDFGDCFVSSWSNMRHLLPAFAKLPHQSIKASLAGVMPLSGDFEPEDTCRFRDLVQDKEFVSYVLGTALDQSLPYGDPTSATNARLLLKLVDTSQENKDVYIDELLIEEGRAQAAQSSKSNGGLLSGKKP